MKKSLHITATWCVALFLFSSSLMGQTLQISGVCIGNTVTLNPVATINGKPAYTANAGTVVIAGFMNVNVNVYWLSAPDNLWVIDFDGTPFFTNPLNSASPPAIPGGPGSWSNLDAGTCPNTTPLRLAGTGALPVELTAFTAELNKNTVQLAWHTATETNNKGFDIQRSIEGKVWQSLGFVDGAGTTLLPQDYLFLDEKPYIGTNYYRLKQTDIDGAVSFSKIVSVTNAKDLTYQIAPNPTKGFFVVNAPKIDESTPLSIVVFDMLGRKVVTKSAPTHTTELDLSAYSAGTYIVELHYGNQVYREKLNKQ
jgi:Secretion system C-terminal sorting domain